MIDDIKYCASERHEVTGGVMTWRDVHRMQRTERFVLRWAEERPAVLGINRPTLPAGWAIPGWERRVQDKQEALRIVEAIAKAMAGY